MLVYLGSLSWDNMTPEERTEYLTPLKGTYNAEDLNRVTEAMEYLVEELTGYGYTVPYVPIEVHPGAPASYTVNNMLDFNTWANNGGGYWGRWQQPGSYGVGWTSSTHPPDGKRSFMFSGPLATGQVEILYPLRAQSSGVVNPFITPSHKYYFSVMLMQPTKDGSFDCYWPIAEPPVMSGATISNLNTWEKKSVIVDRSSFSSGASEIRFDYNQPTGANRLYVSNTILVDLTETFGAGEEPEQAWCDEYFTFNDTASENSADTATIVIEAPGPYRWRREDIPTLAQLTQYLANVQAVRQTLSVAGDLPQTMRFLTWQGANEIERVLSVVEERIQAMIQTFVACGPATCGGDYL